MTHWGWYWKVKKKHKPKALCSSFLEIDSFSMFKNKELVRLVKESNDRISFAIPKYNLIAVLQDDNNLAVQFDGGYYVIFVEKKSCNFGGYYYFFHCPQCDKKMRKLYCLQGKYLCRKCANLGYYTQRLRPSQRCLYLSVKAENFLKNQAGGLDRKPPWKKQHTFQKLRKKYLDYDEKYFYALHKELRDLYGPSIEGMLDSHYSIFVPSGFYDLYDYKDNLDC